MTHSLANVTYSHLIIANLIGNYAVSKNLIVAFGILALPAGIAGVAFHSVDDPVFHFFHDTHMIRHPVLALVPIVPIEEDQVAGARLIVAVLPQPSLLEPPDADGAVCKPGDHTSVQITALVGTPGNEAGTPVHPALEAVPGPIRFPTHIPDLGEGHRHDLLATRANAIQDGAPHTAVFFSQ